MEGEVQQASEIDSTIRSLQRSIAEQDEQIIAALRKGEDTAELERKVADDLIKLNGLQHIFSRRDNEPGLRSRLDVNARRYGFRY
jgi:hypothetical protein